MPRQTAATGGRGAALAGTLHDAETRQLEEFIKKRSKALDGDISEMRKKLGGVKADDALGTLGAAATFDKMKISGVSLLTHSQGTTGAAGGGSSSSSSSELDAAAARRAEMERTLAASSQPRAATMKDRLGTFLARIKISKSTWVRCWSALMIKKTLND